MTTPAGWIGVFCGSKTGSRPAYEVAARRVARGLVERNLGLVYGGGDVGLMGIIADEVLAAGGAVIGVIPRRLVEMEVAHASLTEFHVVETMHERKALMVEKSDAFITLPGGIGSMDEFFETLTWAYLGFHHKPCGLLNVEDYYTPLIRLLDHFVAEGFLSREAASNVVAGENVDAVLNALVSRAPTLED